MIISFTGTGSGMTPAQAIEVRRLLTGASKLVHGGAIGADAQVHSIATELGIPIVIYPSNLPKQRAFCPGAESIYPPRNPLARNADIVKAGDVLIACPAHQKFYRSSTWASVWLAVKAKKRVILIWPDGSNILLEGADKENVCGD